MSDQFWISFWQHFWGNLPATVISLAALIKIFRVHGELNSRLDEWKKETKEATIASNTASKEQGIKEQKEKNEITVPINTLGILPDIEKDKP